MDTRSVNSKDAGSCIIPTAVKNNKGIANNEDGGDQGFEKSCPNDCNPSRLLPSTLNTNPGWDEAPRETLALSATNNERPTAKWNNKQQARYWCLTFNNYTDLDLLKFEQAFERDKAGNVEVVTAIIGKEVGESGTRHLQGYVHFKTLKRQSAVHKFFGYDSPSMHLSVQGKEGKCKGKPPLAAFR